MNAIPTKHDGITFRSRLEARWAVFFSGAGLRWQYEAEGFQLPSGWYLPDFWLPDIETWIEIKPNTPTEEEAGKCAELAITTGKRTILLHGELGWWLIDLYGRTGGGMMFTPDGGGDWPYAPCICSQCHRAGIEWEGHGDRICAHKDAPPMSGRYLSHDHERIKLSAAYATRFQFPYAPAAR